MDEDDEIDEDRAAVPAADWAEYEYLRGLAALQRVLVRARRSDAASTTYTAFTFSPSTVSTLAELRQALEAAGLQLPTREQLQQRAAALGDAFKQAAEDGAAPDTDH